MQPAAQSFEEYWVGFVRAHVRSTTRRVQFVATSLGLASALAGLLWKRGVLVVLAPAVAWIPTRVAQRAFEAGAQRPPVDPVFEVAANLKMWRMTLTGTMQAEVDRLTAESGRPAERPSTPEPNMVTDHTLH